MTIGLKRYYGHGDLHFLTFSCYQRLPLLGTVEARNLFVDALSKIRERYEFLLVGYVVMPNHAHLLISESAKATPSDVLKVLKQRVSRDLRKQNDQNKTPYAKSACGAPHRSLIRNMNEDEGLGHFWQARFYDFNVWSRQKVKEKLEYMHANPIARKLVDHPKDWPWSSWSFYAKGEIGLVPIDPVGW